MFLERGCPVTNMSDTSLEWSKTAGSNSHIDLRSTESIIDLYKDHMTPIDSASWEEFQVKMSPNTTFCYMHLFSSLVNSFNNKVQQFIGNTKN